MKKILNEFRDFISRGNVMDMAVGVIVGGAFTAIVNSLVDDLINPLLGIITGGNNLAEKSINIFGAQIMYGSFITAVINFLLIALVLFFIVKGINAIHERAKKSKPAEPPAPSTKICPFCKSEIPIDATRCPHCTSQLSAEEEKTEAEVQ